MGVLGASIDPRHATFQVLAVAAQQLDVTAYAELVDQNVQVIGASEPGRVLSRGQHPDFYRPLLARRASGVGLTESEGPDKAGQRHALAFVPLESVPWGVALGESEAAFSSLNHRWRWLIAPLGVPALAITFFLVWVTRESIVKPVLALTQISRRIAAGDLATPVPRLGGGEVRVLAAALEEMRLRLRAAAAAQEQVGRLKDEFLATVSHELRTPLGCIKGYATTLLLPDGLRDEGTTRRGLELIAAASDELHELVDNLLDMTKIGAGVLDVHPAPVRPPGGRPGTVVRFTLPLAAPVAPRGQPGQPGRPGRPRAAGPDGPAPSAPLRAFAAAELLARVEAVLRRYRQGGAGGDGRVPPVFVNGKLAIDFAARRIIVGGREVRLTPTEYRLLYHLALNAGRVLVHEELLRRVWGPGYEGQPAVLHTTVRRLRRKLEPDPAAPRYVLARRGLGYLLAAPGGGRRTADGGRRTADGGR